jgi:hypothetical protein
VLIREARELEPGDMIQTANPRYGVHANQPLLVLAYREGGRRGPYLIDAECEDEHLVTVDADDAVRVEVS